MIDDALNMEAISDKSISIIVQGLPSADTLNYLKTLRENFPKAEIIFSTWKNTDVRPYEKLIDNAVFSEDPGGYAHGFYKKEVYVNNLNRQIVSTVAGIKLATRPYVIKLRTDFTLASDELFKFWNKYKRRNEQYRLFGHRIIVASVYSRLYSDQTKIPTPFHPSDFFGCGLKDDMLLFWSSAPLATKEELSEWKYRYPQRSPYKYCQWRFAPEQTLLLNAVLTKFPGIKFYDWTDLKEDILSFSNHILINNFIFVDPQQIGLVSKKHQIGLDRGGRGEIDGLITNDVFDGWYNLYFNLTKIETGNAQSKNNVTKKDPKERFLVHKARFLNPIKNCIKGMGWFYEPFAIGYYWICSMLRNFKI